MKKDLDSKVFFNDDVPVNPTSSQSSASLFVSLYLVILAFFILLNSISEVKKGDQEGVISNIRETFSNAGRDYKTEIYSTDNVAGFEIPSNQYAADIGDVVKDSITLTQAIVEHDGDIAKITIPINILFTKDSSDIRNEHEKFIEDLTNELTKVQTLARTDIEIIIGGIEESTNQHTAKTNLALSRASNFANTLLQAGVSQSSILIGINRQIPSDKIQITFYIRQIIEKQEEIQEGNNNE